ncbi:MAG: hypothetical protein LC102_08660 [Ignavibacteriales bacterium]|nr:MAG: hypothetical protein F9K26_04970 [Ignavibacteriaceae bacterium]MBW7872763.1 hypothetical protein [Ignavibacteria bacterium]MCZ2143483.1 hypothetical protein [Ignavibacteriales bacterium]MBV6444360.1 hypothetical protein [Ignavibacteriaceae bacterium]MBZ0197165.1 hypothetical protein [Ignavibacteriaceae bacterium]
MKHWITLFFAVLFFGSTSAQYNSKQLGGSGFPQSFFFIGGLTTEELTPAHMGNPTLKNSGIVLGWEYNLKKIEDIPIVRDFSTGFNLGGATTFGFTAGSGYLNLPDASRNNMINIPVRTYTGIADFFSVEINSKTAYNFPDDRAVEFSVGLTLLNIGGSVTYFSAGNSFMDNRFTFAVSLLPVYIKPAIKVKLKNITMGLGVLINPTNILEYRWGPEGYYSFEEQGVMTTGASPQKFAVLAYLNL